MVSLSESTIRVNRIRKVLLLIYKLKFADAISEHSRKDFNSLDCEVEEDFLICIDARN